MGWGQWEEGITGTTIKDTWTKSRRRVEVGSAGVGWRDGEKKHTTVLQQQVKTPTTCSLLPTNFSSAVPRGTIMGMVLVLFLFSFCFVLFLNSPTGESCWGQ